MIFLFIITILKASTTGIFLRFNPKINTENLYKIETISTHRIIKTDIEQKINSKVEILLSEKVLNFKDSFYTLLYKIEKFEFKMNENDVKNPLFEELKNSTYTVKISSTGKILKKSLNKKFLILDIPEFPDKRIKKGDKWNFKKRSFIPFGKTNIDIEIEGAYSVNEIKKNIVKISGNLKINAINVYPIRTKKRVESNFIGNGKSEIIYDYKNSKLLSLKETLNLKTKSKAFFPDFPAQNFEMLHKIETTLKNIK